MRTPFRLTLLICLIGIANFLLTIQAHVMPEIFLVLISGALWLFELVLLCYSAYLAFKRCRKATPYWALPIIFSLSAFAGTYLYAGNFALEIADARLGNKLPQYYSTIADFQKGKIQCTFSCDGYLSEVPQAQLPDGVQSVWGAHCNDQGVTVLFLLKTDLPLLHRGYLYRNYGTNSDCYTNANSPDPRGPQLGNIRHIKGYWYSFGDQPGF